MSVLCQTLGIPGWERVIFASRSSFFLEGHVFSIDQWTEDASLMERTEGSQTREKRKEVSCSNILENTGITMRAKIIGTKFIYSCFLLADTASPLQALLHDLLSWP
jgi:hypothetical protein